MPQSRLWPARRQRAFTLIEIAVVVVIIGVLVAIGLPGYRKMTMKSKATAVINDFRTFSAAYVNFNLQNGRYPDPTGAAGDPGEIGNGVSVAFTKPTPIGGQYEWIKDTHSVKAAIGITLDGGADLDLLEMIDSMMDDGNTGTGSVQLSGGTELIYIIEQ